uniref:Uncharacterized protein n=1 Tax=Ditylenchus dipsaci TaxID=166011 RepID=A0A915CXW9_9BILA
MEAVNKTTRLLRLHQSQQLQLDGEYGGKVFFFLVGDKRGSSTKIAIGIANVKSVNSYVNLLMVALFQGDYNYEIWFLTGDMKIFCSLIGHLGPNATHSCLLCEACSTPFKKNVAGEERTLDKIEESAEKYQEKYDVTPAETSREDGLE